MGCLEISSMDAWLDLHSARGCVLAWCCARFGVLWFPREGTLIESERWANSSTQYSALWFIEPASENVGSTDPSRAHHFIRSFPGVRGPGLAPVSHLAPP